MPSNETELQSTFGACGFAYIHRATEDEPVLGPCLSFSSAILLSAHRRINQLSFECPTILQYAEIIFYSMAGQVTRHEVHAVTIVR